MSGRTTTPGGRKTAIRFAETIITPEPGDRRSQSNEMEAEDEGGSQTNAQQQNTPGTEFGRATMMLDKEETGDQESGQESEDTSTGEQQSDTGEEDGMTTQSSKPRGSVLKSKKGEVPRGRTRFLLGIPPANKGKMVEEALGALKDLYTAVVKVDSTAVLEPWKEADRGEVEVATMDMFPTKKSTMELYTESFNVMPPKEGRWYTAVCINHAGSIKAEEIISDIEETVRNNEWLFQVCAIQTDKRSIDIGWFAFSIKEYSSPEFRDRLAGATGVSNKYFALQWGKVKQAGNDLWAMTVKSDADWERIVNKALGALYSSTATDWPWGIRMRYIPYKGTLGTQNNNIDRMKANQRVFLKDFKAIPVDHIKIDLADLFETSYRSGPTIKITLREAIMGIMRTKDDKDLKQPTVNSRPPRQGVFHGVVEYNDKFRGRRKYVVPYPVEQVGTSVGWMMIEYPVTMMAAFYSRESVVPLFATHAVEAEEDTVYDVGRDRISNQVTKDLEASFEQDAKFFKFDLSLVQKEGSQQEKKRKLATRLDDSSVGTIRGETTGSAAGSSTTGTRPAS
jgi:hypothetical protein